MIVTLEDALFSSAVDPLLLLSVLHHGFEGRHIILTDPVFRKRGQTALNAWLAARDPLVRDAAEEALNRSLTAYGSTPSRAEFRVELRQQSRWEDRLPVLTLGDAARVLAMPLLLVLENRQGDRYFLQCVIPSPRREVLRKVFERGWVRAEHGGGLGDMKNYIEGLRDEPAERMRVWVLFDSDAPQPAQPSGPSEEVRRLCLEASLPHHQLQRRSIENYLTLEALNGWAAERMGVSNSPRRRAVQAFAALERRERHHADMKDRFEKGIARLFREEKFPIDPMWLQNDGQRPELDAIAQGLFERM